MNEAQSLLNLPIKRGESAPMLNIQSRDTQIRPLRHLLIS